MFFEGLYYPPRDSAQPDEWRARREEGERKRAEWEVSPEGIALNAEVDALLAKSYAAHGWSSNVGQLDFDQRTELMLKVDNGGPVASGRLPAAKIASRRSNFTSPGRRLRMLPRIVGSS